MGLAPGAAGGAAHLGDAPPRQRAAPGLGGEPWGCWETADIDPLGSRTSYVWKEANRLEEVEAGLGHDLDEVYAEYADPGRDPWRGLVLPVLRRIPAKRLVEEMGLAASTVKAARNGSALPHRRNREALTQAVAAFAWERLRGLGLAPSADDLAACVAYLGAYPTT